ncbi:MAG: hydroxymethylglutaryl-CoA lyase [Acidimicrobiaceae bacterium]|jgi:hydroxymethylglutaryl-CoA lyase|nr:hydroxymethylglutaryl-CoA lyase [Acidimicrobiaceae bacterium]
MSPWPQHVEIREVGPRDGLQAERPIPVGDRAALIDALAATGASDIEAVAFVSPRLVPAMAGATDVLAQISRRPGVRYWALVPNARGAEAALAAGVDGLSVTASASETYSEKNVGMSVAESVAELGRIAGLVEGRLPVDAVVSCAFGSPFEGDIAPGAVAALGRQLLAAGATALTFADTTGMASPRRIAALLRETGTTVGLHLHDTRGTALVNAFAALQEGVGRFDCSVGGLGGSPFAPGAGGNLATEDLVHLLDDLGVSTGIDLTALLAASQLVASLVGHAVPSRVAHALV